MQGKRCVCVVRDGLRSVRYSNLRSFVEQVESTIFPPDSGGAVAMAKEMNVPFLGSIPLDPLLARACDEGRNIFIEFPQSPVCAALANIVKGKEAICVYLA